MSRKERLIGSTVVLLAAALIILVLIVFWYFFGYSYRVLPPLTASMEAGSSAAGLLGGR